MKTLNDKRSFNAHTRILELYPYTETDPHVNSFLAETAAFFRAWACTRRGGARFFN